jgi:hypothetical protein
VRLLLSEEEFHAKAQGRKKARNSIFKQALKTEKPNARRFV